MKKVAVILSGCGYLDGTEITEAILTLLSLDKLGAKVSCFAPNKKSALVKNHVTDKGLSDMRNVLVESARISRGVISDLLELEAQNFDCIVIPGGFGVMQNLFNPTHEQEIIPKLKEVLIDFWKLKKPIAGLCISPALIVSALKDHVTIDVTIGADKDNFIHKLGGRNFNCKVTGYHHDKLNNVFSTPAYMVVGANMSDIAIGVDSMINACILK